MIPQTRPLPPLDSHARSDFLDQMYSMSNQTNVPKFPEPEEMMTEPDLTPDEECRLKRNALQALTTKMTLHAIPCDPGYEKDLLGTVTQHVDRYFHSHNPERIVQYFNDTKNPVTDAFREAFADHMDKEHPIAEDDNKFITAVLDEVTDDDKVNDVVDKIKGDIEQSAQNEVKEIVDDIKDDPEDENQDQNDQSAEIPDTQPETPMGIDTTADSQINESVFHHYLIKHYKENAVPDDPEAMLITPMVETALHYVTRVLFNDGFARRMGMEV